MRQAAYGLLAAILCLVGGGAWGGEPYREFLEGLRERKFFDYAMLYIEQIEKDPALPDEVKQTLDYEKAVTLMQGASEVKNPEAQTRQLDQAEAFLEQFVKANPAHPLAARANSERAQIFINKARVEVIQSRSPANAGSRETFQLKARDLVAKARQIYQAAHDQFEAQWKSFPIFIEESSEPDKFEQRRLAEMSYIKAQLDLALCTYEEAQTYDAKSAEYKATLTRAAGEFEQMHQKYRTQVGGLFARMWQGKCFEEQEDIGKALGIYNELLEHPGGSATMDRLQDQVLQFRLICLNHDQRKDYQLVIDQSSAWIAQSKSKLRTVVGLGIQWERARAAEAMGNKRELSKADTDKYLKAALADATAVNKYPGPYKDVSTLMMQRVSAAMGRGGDDPKDFDGALGLGRTMVKQIKELEDKITGARRAGKTAAELKPLEDELSDHLKETARILRLALTLVREDTEVSQANTARHLLSFVDYKRGNYYEAAILGAFIAERYPTLDSQMALDSAYVAMAAWQQSYQNVYRANRLKKPEEIEEKTSLEVGQMMRVANLIAKNWPGSDRANEACMTLGQLYSQQHEPVRAAEWFGQVPESSAEYADAQLAAGQAFWTAYLEAALAKDEDKPTKEELDKWDAAAEKHLQIGIDKHSAGLPKDGPVPDTMTAAKASLAQIKIIKGNYTDAIQLIVGDPHPIASAIALKDGEARPATGVKSQPFYILVYSSLLRSYVGTQEIDKALDAMNKLEAIAGGAQSAEVMRIYEELGRELQKEIERLKGLGASQRLADLQSSFNKFLEELYKRKDTMTYSSLTWIAETYYSLGKGLDDNPSVAADYYRKASSSFGDVIARAEKGDTEEDRQFASSGRLIVAKLRLVECRRREGNFDEALNYLADVLKAYPNNLEPQLSAALTYQEWGMTGQPDAQKRLIEAIDGPSEGPLAGKVWGWRGIAFRLQPQIEGPNARANMKEQYREARYNGTFCRYQYGKGQSSSSRKQEELSAAKGEVDAFALVAGDIPDTWFVKFDGLYQDIQKELDPGTPPTPLERPKEIVATAYTPKPPPVAAEDVAPPPPPSPPVKPATTSPVVVALVVIVGLAAVGGAIFMMIKPKKRLVRVGPSDESPVFGGPPAARPRPAAAGAAAAGGRTTAASGAARPAGAKPAAGAPQRPAAKPAAGPRPSNPKPQS